MIYGASHDRRHHQSPLYILPIWQSRPTEFLDVTSLTLDEFQPLIPPSRRRSTRIMARGASMRNPGPHAGFASTRTVPCRRQKIGCSSCSRP